MKIYTLTIMYISKCFHEAFSLRNIETPPFVQVLVIYAILIGLHKSIQSTKIQISCGFCFNVSHTS
jgi:hypothetical protein